MIDANIETLLELKTLLYKFMGSVKVLDIGNPFKSKSAVKHWSGAQVCNVEGLEVLLSGGHKNYTETTLEKKV
jgi:hypothetical protein